MLGAHLDTENVPGDEVLQPEAVPEQTPEVAQPETEEAEQAESKPELTPEQKTIKALQRRIDRLTAGRGAASREAELRGQEAAELREHLARLQKPEGQEDDQRLDPKALDRLASEKAQALRRRDRINDRVAETEVLGAKLAGSSKAFVELCNAVAEEVPFTDARGNPTPFMEAVLDSKVVENPAGLLAYLGKNPDEAAQFVGLSEAQIGRRLAKLEDRIAREAKEQTSKAPKPLESVKGNARADKDLSEMSYSEFVEARRKHLAKR